MPPRVNRISQPTVRTVLPTKSGRMTSSSATGFQRRRQAREPGGDRQAEEQAEQRHRDRDERSVVRITER